MSSRMGLEREREGSQGIIPPPSRVSLRCPKVWQPGYSLSVVMISGMAHNRQVSGVGATS